MSARSHAVTLSVALAVLAFSTSASWARGVGAGSPKPIDDAELALREGRYADAEVAFRARLLEDPASLPALEGWAEALIGQDRGDEALGSLRRAAETILSRGAPAAAVRLLELALRATPNDSAVEARLGMALMLDRRFVAAELHLRSAWQAGERGPRELLYFAACLWETGNLEEAEERYLEAVERTGGSAVALYELGRLLLWEGRAEEAVELIERALAAGQGGLGPRLDLARALERLAREDDTVAERAVAAFRDAVELAPEHSEVRYGLARALLLADQREEAERELATYRLLQAEDQERGRERARSEARSARVRELIVEGRVDEARALLDGLPDLAEVWHARALLERFEGNTEGAIAALEQALALDAERADLAALLTELRTRR